MIASASPASGPLLPYGSADRPGTGGHIKATPEDFVVEEAPRYVPSGHGEHLYLWVEKRGLPTEAVVQRLRRALGVPASAVGAAGKKDAHALTRQWLSVHTAADPDPAGLGDARWRVLAASRHRNKLRPGHLAGNRFTVVVREAHRHAGADAHLAALARAGFPSYFGPQRLGSGLANALDGRRLLQGARLSRRDLERTRFAVNAYQAALFNALVAQRLTVLGSLETLLPGDLAVLHRNGAAFAVPEDELPATRTRAAAHEVSPSAPLFGTHVPLAEGTPGAWERDLLAREGLGADAFRLGTRRLSPKGERRAVRAFAEGLAWDWLEEAPAPALRLTFTLAPGVYATSLLREVMRNDDLALLPPPDAPGGPRT